MFRPFHKYPYIFEIFRSFSEIFRKIGYYYIQKVQGYLEILIAFMAEPCVFLAIALKQYLVLGWKQSSSTISPLKKCIESTERAIFENGGCW